MEAGREGGREEQRAGREGGGREWVPAVMVGAVRTFVQLYTGCPSHCLCYLDIKSPLTLNPVSPSVSLAHTGFDEPSLLQSGAIFSVAVHTHTHTHTHTHAPLPVLLLLKPLRARTHTDSFALAHYPTGQRCINDTILSLCLSAWCVQCFSGNGGWVGGGEAVCV